MVGFDLLLTLVDCKPMFKFRKPLQRRQRPAHIDFYGSLEPRHLLAGIFFDTADGELRVVGGANDDVGQVAIVGNQVEASLLGFESQRFPIADVSKVIFLGFAGNDQFTNDTSIEGALFGHAGDDVLTGGFAFDSVNGGHGNDELTGRAGDDRMLGGPGDDLIRGNNGNDAIFSGPGINDIWGHDGDDTIFGGPQVDTVFGGAGMDRIYAAGGDDVIYSGAGGVPGSSGTSEADLVLGLDGDDTIVGESGLDIFYGGNGNDSLTGGSGENRLHGQNGEDVIRGGIGDDYLTGGNDNDQIFAAAGNDYVYAGEGHDLVYGGDGRDYLRGQLGNDQLYGENDRDFLEGGWGFDYLYGGSGNNVAVYQRGIEDYSVKGNESYAVVDALVSLEDIDELSDIAFSRFNGTDQDMSALGPLVVTVQPIIVSNDNGGNTAEFFGNASEQADIQQRVDEIMAVANIDVQWLTPNTWNHSFANVGNGGYRPGYELDSLISMGDTAGVGNTDPLVLDMYFVEVVPGYEDTGENYVNGYAYIGFNGIAMHVGDRMVTSESRRDTVARVTAHEIAHNLGLDHVDDEGNLMKNGYQLAPWQIDIMTFSNYAV
jgi:Ca2+-binding RTX toxin-like protein/predicted Zn-dependent protease